MSEAVNAFVERYAWLPMAVGGIYGRWFFWWLVTEPDRRDRTMLKEVEE